MTVIMSDKAALFVYRGGCLAMLLLVVHVQTESTTGFRSASLKQQHTQY